MKIKKLTYALLILLVASFILVEGLIIANAHNQDVYQADYLLILGAGVDGDKPRLLLQNRLEKGVQYLNNNSEAKVILSGGRGPGENVTEAEVMKRYLLDHNVSTERMLIEERSTSTYENLLFTRQLLAAEGVRGEVRLVIITSDFHMFRAKLLAKSQGFIAYGLPADTPKQNSLYYYLREYLAVIKTVVIDLI